MFYDTERMDYFCDNPKQKCRIAFQPEICQHVVNQVGLNRRPSSSKWLMLLSTARTSCMKKLSKTLTKSYFVNYILKHRYVSYASHIRSKRPKIVYLINWKKEDFSETYRIYYLKTKMFECFYKSLTSNDQFMYDFILIWLSVRTSHIR